MFAVKFQDQHYSPSDFKGMPENTRILSNISIADMAMLYNMVGSELKTDKPVNKFKDKPTAITRTWNILVEYFKKTGQQPPKVEKPKPEHKTPTINGIRKTRIMRFTFGATEGQEIVHPKDMNTLRGQCVVLLKAGATFEQVKQLVVDFDVATNRKTDPNKVERRAYELVRIMHYFLNYGIKHDIQTGIITLISK